VSVWALLPDLNKSDSDSDYYYY